MLSWSTKHEDGEEIIPWWPGATSVEKKIKSHHATKKVIGGTYFDKLNL
jgi:hypothetical protein